MGSKAKQKQEVAKSKWQVVFIKDACDSSFVECRENVWNLKPVQNSTGFILVHFQYLY